MLNDTILDRKLWWSGDVLGDFPEELVTVRVLNVA
jgi:hypothetical protein